MRDLAGLLNARPTERVPKGYLDTCRVEVDLVPGGGGAGGSRGLPKGRVSGGRHGRESAVIVGDPTVGRPQPAEKADHCPGGPPSAAVQSNNQQGRCAVAESPKNLSEPDTLG